MKKGIQGNRVKLATLFVLMAVLISACGGRSDSSPSPGGPSESEQQEKGDIYWITQKVDVAEKELYNRLVIQPFEKAHPGSSVKWVETENPTAAARQQLAAGAGPDIVTTDGPTLLAEFAKANYLLPLDDYADKYGWKDRFFDWAYETGFVNGKLYGLPSEYETMLVWYNKDMFRENGWSVPTSYEELFSLGQSMMDKGIIPFGYGSGDVKAANAWWYSIAFGNTLGSEEMKRMLKGDIPWNNELMKEAAQKLVDLYQNGYISDKKAPILTMDDGWNLFASGKAAMDNEGTWVLARLADKKPDFEVGFFTMPAWRSGVEADLQIGLGSMTGINANTSIPGLASDFLDRLYTAETAAAALQFGQFYPVKEVGSGSDALDPLVKQVYETLDKALEGSAGYLSWTYYPPRTDSYLWQNLDSVLLQQMTVDEFLDHTQAKAEEDAKNGSLFNFKD
ncbi:ABC transporter substrate-binding protein [Cohnella hongkongensis]|uniref:ABC transporter substrate-binding protein n=1 Tax=Cohnella hongkongensis TaxID=178337 RepID=A0ABV9FA26_9BACL